MKSKSPNLNYAWAELMIRELGRLGVDHVFICPGSRSSPLALSAADHAANTTVHFDERGAAFAALGCARATGRPAAVITTSGSAVANLWPAVSEASADEVPLILITADRPPELRDTAANQTMDQAKIFGGFVRYQVDLPCPDTRIDPGFLLAAVDQAVHRATSGQPGPVHLNQMFREPLAPVKADDGAADWLKRARDWWTSAGPMTAYAAPDHAVPFGPLLEAADLLASARRGIIVAGALPDVAASNAVLSIAHKLGWPVLPDIRSGLRIGRAGPNVVRFADLVLLSPALAEKQMPDVVLHVGGRLTSKRLMQFIGRSGARVAMVHPSPARTEQGAVPALRLPVRAETFAAQLPDFKSATPAAWLKRWQQADKAAEKTWRSIADRESTLTEPMIAQVVSRLLPAHHALALASSMPVRDMEMFGLSELESIRILCNRGVSGIDGNLATAAGFALGSDQPVTLVVGDLALLHDLNSLILAARSRVPVIVIVINNDGGGIFSFLPIAETPRHFETCFGAPHGVTFEGAATMFGLAYHRPDSVESFCEEYQTACREGKSALIEVNTDRSVNLADHRVIQAAIKKAVDRAIR